MRIENILGTTKEENESWEDVFKRVNEERGIDIKILSGLVCYLLEANDKAVIVDRSTELDRVNGSLSDLWGRHNKLSLSVDDILGKARKIPTKAKPKVKPIK